MEAVKVTRRAKGEKTREKILKAAIEVIASVGIKGTTHRAVAKKADAQLSLTTYYFKDIKELIREAIILSSTIFIESSSGIWHKVFAYLDEFDATSMRKVTTREEICHKVTDAATQHMYENIIHRPVGLAVEQIFFTEMMYQPELQDLAIAHVEKLRQPFIKLASYFNKVDPEIDAELALMTITRIQYQCLSQDKNDVDIEQIRKLVYRQLAWVLKLKR
ncbi:TetR/AcrR family transcriptional regulator [Thalassotalea sp. HSM 43]|uniref:TetR/AcrR family transcriptional regulator n=1 Tax=Thalassotalea sp. HSM 43 TaxID=2552945 RepID=UPI0016769346|nr:TetR family transcriptional regulator [Thalassotalea sp. HSM 43]